MRPSSSAGLTRRAASSRVTRIARASRSSRSRRRAAARARTSSLLGILQRTLAGVLTFFQQRLAFVLGVLARTPHDELGVAAGALDLRAQRLERAFDLVAVPFRLGDLQIAALLRAHDDRQEPAEPCPNQDRDEDDRRYDLAPDRNPNVELCVGHLAASGMTRSSMKSARPRTASSSPSRAVSNSSCALCCASSTMACACCA